MTENEAIEYMENEVRCIKQASHCDRDCLKCGLVKEEQPLLESFAVAIQALEEIQQYRAIGTVEDIKKGIKQSEEEFEMLMQYMPIGTVEEFKALKEKNEPKKPEVDEFDYGEGFVCGECESFLHYVDDDDEHIRTNYCCHCGTKIDWQ